MDNKGKNINLDSLKNENPFKVPENYFESLTERVMVNVEASANTSNTTKIIRFIKPVLALAASFAIIFMLVYIPVRTLHPQASDSSEITEEQGILDYIYLNDHAVYTALADEQPDEYSEELIETVLLASVSDMELLDLKN